MKWLIALLVPAAGFCAAGSKTCAGSSAVANFHLRVSSPTGGQPLPIRQVNNIPKGSKLTLTPLRLPPDVKKNARMTLVVAPADTVSGDAVSVLDLRPVDSPGEWVMPFRVGVLVLVFGPQGLDEKRVVNLVSKDEDLLAELAGYADQTEQLEDTIDVLSASDDAAEDDAALAARGTPTDQVLFALSRALNSVTLAYNPLGAGRRAGSATNKGKAAEAFFENAGGVIPGGGALPAVKGWLMPDTEFRTVYTEPAEKDAMTLCGQRKPTGSRNRFAYLWAHRLVSGGAPSLTLPQAAWAPLGARSAIAVKAKSADEYPLIDRVREWVLAGGSAPVPVKLRWDQRRSIELDLRNAQLKPGVYRLEGKWDWDAVRVSGELHLAPLADVTKVRVAAESQAKLVDGTGLVPVKLEGADFQFVERLTLRKAGRLGVGPSDLEYVLPIGPRAGEQPLVEVEIDTGRFHAGTYQLAMAQTGGGTQTMQLQIAGARPSIDNLPIAVAMGARDQRVVLRGSGLDRIKAITSERATIRLGASKGTEREVFVTLAAEAKKGEHLALQVTQGDAAEAATVADGILVGGPRPRIAGVKASPPEDLSVALREGEVPAGSLVVLSLQVENLETPAALQLECHEPGLTLQPLRLRVGERQAGARLDRVAEGTLLAAVDVGTVGTPDCTLQATVETQSAGVSESVPLGRVVRLPRIESVTLTDEKAEQGYAAILKGRDLETIAKTGWDANNGVAVTALPRGLAGEGERQTLRVVVPWPSPTPMAPLYVWLRGDTAGRAVARK